MKRLIYFTLGNSSSYIKLADLCVKSLYLNGYDGDFLFITDLKDEILSNIDFKRQPIFLELERSSLLESSANKLKIYLFDRIGEYDRIIFSDLDVLWTSSPDSIFGLIDESGFFMSNEEGLMSHELWGGLLLSEAEKTEIESQKVFGLNAGIFAFGNKMVPYLKEIDQFLNDNLELQNSCLEQPFFNVYAYRNKLYNTRLNGLVSHRGCKFAENATEYDGAALHFAGGPGAHDHKLYYMKSYFDAFLHA